MAGTWTRSGRWRRKGPAFIQGLRAGYLAEADNEYKDYDFGDYDHFARKTVTSAKGLNVQPDLVSLRELAPEHVDELTAARARLMAGLDGDGRRKAPFAMARAQVAFDCWLEQQEENDIDDIARCKAAFEAAMAEVEDALASNLDNVYIVFFAWDKSEITPVVAGDHRQRRSGFQRRQGDPHPACRPRRHLRSRRLQPGACPSVAPAPLQPRSRRKGVDVPTAIDVEWFGETELRVWQTP